MTLPRDPSEHPRTLPRLVLLAIVCWIALAGVSWLWGSWLPLVGAGLCAATFLGILIWDALS